MYQKRLFFLECRKIQRSELTASCEDDEIAVGCEATGGFKCGARQVFDGKGCMVNACGDVPYPSSKKGALRALCCKRDAVHIA